MDTVATSLPSRPSARASHHKASLAALTLGALGVVFGDIGTSPIYTMRVSIEALKDHGGASEANVYGILSLVFWSLTAVVTVKYLMFIMRADNHGEGGIFALLAIVPERLRMNGTKLTMVALVVVVGAALLYGDGAITPAISVLSAIEGGKIIVLGRDAPTENPDGTAIAEPGWLTPTVVGVTCVILLALFLVQRRGTGAVGAAFGPIMLLWFLTIGALGGAQIIQHPDILAALSPEYAVRYFIAHGAPGFVVLGSVVLAVTGGEALYADMGHFGKRPIRVAWLSIAMPCLVLCYFGQGALILHDPNAYKNPFFFLVESRPLIIALVVLSSLATVIASQALISGAFSLTRQAMLLGYFPRVTIRHTAAHTEGQIYIPQINWILAVGCLLLVVAFQKSDNLASAYGIAVTGTMMLTSFVYYTVVRNTWKWSLPASLAVLVLFLSFDIPFFAANTVKILDGGWVPVLIGVAFISAMLIWSKGRTLVVEQYTHRFASMEEAVPRLLQRIVARTPGLGVFMASSPTHVPPIMMHLVERERVLHEQVLLLTVITEPVPEVAEERHLQISHHGNGIHRAVVTYGFMQEPDVPAVVKEVILRAELGALKPDDITYYLGRETVLATDSGSMKRFAESIFSYLQRNAVTADKHFKIPPKQVIEIGIQLDL